MKLRHLAMLTVIIITVAALVEAQRRNPPAGTPPTGMTPERLMAAFPKGVILAWYPGPTDKVPAGWAVCDGKNGTPDLKGRFLMGAEDPGNISQIGSLLGAPNHSHAVSTTGSGTGRATARDAGDNWGPLRNHDAPETTGTNHEHPVSVNVTTSGNSDTRDNIPPSMRIVYIIKL